MAQIDSTCYCCGVSIVLTVPNVMIGLMLLGSERIPPATCEDCDRLECYMEEHCKVNGMSKT